MLPFDSSANSGGGLAAHRAIDPGTAVERCRDAVSLVRTESVEGAGSKGANDPAEGVRLLVIKIYKI